jgi:hypothetical protein
MLRLEAEWDSQPIQLLNFDKSLQNLQKGGGLHESDPSNNASLNSAEHAAQNTSVRNSKLFFLLLKNVFENRVLRIFGPNRDEIMGEWRKLHNGELHDLYSTLRYY